MKRSKEELGRIHKERCRELKGIRAQIAQDLGIELHQTECTYEGYCSGTCPKCRSEELRLNAAMLKKQLQEADLKRRVTAAGLTTVVALGLTGCDIGDVYVTEGTPSMPQEEVLEGAVIEIMDSSESTEGTEVILMGEMPLMTDEITGEE
ncbi:MAG: hypothetical protein IKL04_01850 [Lachnospiraceae bacterium]|nr:hypothetical protein [Lachnospiraceae bacterium]